MAGIRALEKRAGKLENTAMPTPSPFVQWFGSFDAWVESEVLPGVEGGTLAAEDMVAVVAGSMMAHGRRPLPQFECAYPADTGTGTQLVSPF